MEQDTANIKLDDNNSSHRSDGFGPPEIDPTEIELQEEIGVGSFGHVYRGTCRHQPVAVKILNKVNLEKKALLAFKREVKIMSKIFHPNICLFMGACTAEGKCMIVTEILPRGDVESLLRDNRVNLSSLTKMRMAKDAALGMNWLHLSNPVFIHRDLKSSNLLVDEHLHVKVCDFGLSQLIPRDKKIKDKQNAKGTPLWMAPEVMQFLEFDEKCDVYSFGIVLWELVTREEPFAAHSSFDTFKRAVCEDHERPPIPTHTVPSLRQLMEACWDANPLKRPSFQEILPALDRIIVDLAIRDEEGRAFWWDRWGAEADVSWRKFEDELMRFLRSQSSEKDSEEAPSWDSVIARRCLHAIFASPKIRGGGEVVSMETVGKLIDWLGPLGMDPRGLNILHRLTNLLSKDWFHGDISTADAQNRLSTLPGGAFLVRFSSTQPGCYTISSLFQVNGGIKHQRVMYLVEKGFNLNGKWYDSLEDLIRDSPTLQIPCPGSKYQSLFMAQDMYLGGYVAQTTPD